MGSRNSWAIALLTLLRKWPRWRLSDDTKKRFATCGLLRIPRIVFVHLNKKFVAAHIKRFVQIRFVKLPFSWKKCLTLWWWPDTQLAITTWFGAALLRFGCHSHCLLFFGCKELGYVAKCLKAYFLRFRCKSISNYILSVGFQHKLRHTHVNTSKSLKSYRYQFYLTVWRVGLERTWIAFSWRYELILWAYSVKRSKVLSNIGSLLELAVPFWIKFLTNSCQKGRFSTIPV